MLTEALAVTSKCFLEQVHLNCSLKENINCNLLVIAYISESNFFYSPGLLHELISLQELRDREAKTHFLSPQRECRKLPLIHVTPLPSQLEARLSARLSSSPARGWEFYLRVFNSISQEWAQRTSEISSWTREDKTRIHKRACNILFIIFTGYQIFVTGKILVFHRCLCNKLK